MSCFPRNVNLQKGQTNKKMFSAIGGHAVRRAAFCTLIFSLSMGLVFAAQAQESHSTAKLIIKAKAFIGLMNSGAFEKATADFDETMARVMPPAKTKEVWEQVTGQVGKFVRQLSTRTERAGIYDIILVTCRFERATLDVKVVFNPKEQISGLFFVPPKPEAKYSLPDYATDGVSVEKNVEFGLKAWRLPATLTLPSEKGPFPAVVLVHGSGPNDRDESIGPNKPFKDLALGLASRGIAVLRYEKRTKVYNAAFLKPGTRFTVKEETVEDAVLAADYLMARPEIDAQSVYVLGHSLGGMLIPRIARAEPRAAGFISLAGATRPLEDMIMEQYNYVFNLDGRITDKEKESLEKLKNQVARIKTLTEADIEANRQPILGAFLEYWLDLRGMNPPQAAKAITRPFLILQGQRDYQVTEEDFNNWKKALGKKKNAHFKLYPGLDHLFIKGTGKISPAEYQKPGHVAVQVIDDIAEFIKNRK